MPLNIDTWLHIIGDHVWKTVILILLVLIQLIICGLFWNGGGLTVQSLFTVQSSGLGLPVIVFSDVAFLISWSVILGPWGVLRSRVQTLHFLRQFSWVLNKRKMSLLCSSHFSFWVLTQKSWLFWWMSLQMEVIAGLRSLQEMHLPFTWHGKVFHFKMTSYTYALGTYAILFVKTIYFYSNLFVQLLFWQHHNVKQAGPY